MFPVTTFSADRDETPTKHEETNLIPVRGGGHRVLGSQCYAASSYDQQDGHFKVPEVHHIVTRATHPGGKQMAR